MFAVIFGKVVILDSRPASVSAGGEGTTATDGGPGNADGLAGSGAGIAAEASGSGMGLPSIAGIATEGTPMAATAV